MQREKVDFLCFKSIYLSEPEIFDKKVRSTVKLEHMDGKSNSFTLMLKYEKKPSIESLPILRMAFIMPLLNYGLFTNSFKLGFPLSRSDLDLVKELNRVFSRDIYVNKILRRRANYILPEYIPKDENVKMKDANPRADAIVKKIVNDEKLTNFVDSNKSGVLSSGGKESLLTYGMLKEIGSTVYPLYVNESGGHWRTALSAYRHHKKIDKNTRRVWTNVDRFYVFMLDNLKFIRSDHRRVRADTYPLRLCIFPFYVFALLPLYVENNIGNLLIGSEFDDLRISPKHLGILHYYGVYDQHQDYDNVMNKWYNSRIPGFVQWSAVRNVSGLIVERILVNRYPEIARYQRSCHSCHFENKKIVPCGSCSKCMGVLLFLLANKSNPSIMGFKKRDIDSFTKRVNPSNLRLDNDEKNQSFYLIGSKNNIPNVQPVDHVEKIHVNPFTCNPCIMPPVFRDKLFEIFDQYTTGYCELKNGEWINLKEKQIIC